MVIHTGQKLTVNGGLCPGCGKLESWGMEGVEVKIMSVVSTFEWSVA